MLNIGYVLIVVICAFFVDDSEAALQLLITVKILMFDSGSTYDGDNIMSLVPIGIIMGVFYSFL